MPHRVSRRVFCSSSARRFNRKSIKELVDDRCSLSMDWKKPPLGLSQFIMECFCFSCLWQPSCQWKFQLTLANTPKLVLKRFVIAIRMHDRGRLSRFPVVTHIRHLHQTSIHVGQIKLAMIAQRSNFDIISPIWPSCSGCNPCPCPPVHLCVPHACVLNNNLQAFRRIALCSLKTFIAFWYSH